jgi:hypothetical protein
MRQELSVQIRRRLKKRWKETVRRISCRIRVVSVLCAFRVRCTKIVARPRLSRVCPVSRSPPAATTTTEMKTTWTLGRRNRVRTRSRYSLHHRSIRECNNFLFAQSGSFLNYGLIDDFLRGHKRHKTSPPISSETERSPSGRRFREQLVAEVKHERCSNHTDTRVY